MTNRQDFFKITVAFYSVSFSAYHNYVAFDIAKMRHYAI